jgi:hypothetical protein
MNQLDEPNIVTDPEASRNNKFTDRTNTSKYINTANETEALGLFTGKISEIYVDTDLKPLESIETHNRLDKMRQIKN